MSDSLKDTTLFLPLTYNENYKVAGETKLTEVYSGYIGLEVHEGNNNITIEISNKYLNYGAILSILGIILTILFSHFKIFKNKVINNIVYYSHLTLFSLFIIFAYCISALFFIISFI